MPSESGLKRPDYFNAIESKLSFLAFRLGIRGGLNILDMHVHAEGFYVDFFNLLFDLKLKNLNAANQNAAGIDLVDDTNKRVLQVSSTATKQKVLSALSKDLSAYSGYSFQFISISKDASHLRTNTYENPHKLVFTPAKDIHDVPSLLKFIGGLPVARQAQVYEFLQAELNSEPDDAKVESNLTTIINLLSKEDWNQKNLALETTPYNIESKIAHNELEKAKALINDYKVHHPRIEKIYSDFDTQGANKSLSILSAIRSVYSDLSPKSASSDECFFSIIKAIVKTIKASKNYSSFPEEELELSVAILVADAFIRCKIFNNPSRGADAHS